MLNKVCSPIQHSSASKCLSVNCIYVNTLVKCQSTMKRTQTLLLLGKNNDLIWDIYMNFNLRLSWYGWLILGCHVENQLSSRQIPNVILSLSLVVRKLQWNSFASQLCLWMVRYVVLSLEELRVVWSFTCYLHNYWWHVIMGTWTFIRVLLIGKGKMNSVSPCYETCRLLCPKVYIGDKIFRVCLCFGFAVFVASRRGNVAFCERWERQYSKNKFSQWHS